MEKLKEKYQNRIEKKFLNFFLKFQENFLEESSSIKDLREFAIKFLCKNGLPSSKLEDWHYTNLQEELKNICFKNSNKKKYFPKKPIIKDSFIISSLEKEFPQNSKKIFCNLQNSLSNDIEKSSKGFSIYDIIYQINTAFLNNGRKICLLNNTNFNKIIEIQNFRQRWTHTNFPILIGKNQNIIIIQRQIGGYKNSLLSTINKLQILENSKVILCILHEKDSFSIDFENFSSVLEENSHLTIFTINTGSQYLRQEIFVDLRGDYSNFELYNVNLLSKDHHIDINTKVQHIGKKTKSKVIIRNISENTSKGIFQGKIKVNQDSQKSNAKMSCKTMIISKEASFFTKPELEIFADDVSCSHGATVSNINNDHLFYLMSRGISKNIARKILIKSFSNEIIQKCENKIIKHNLLKIINRILKKFF